MWAASGCNAPTSILVSIDAPAVRVTSLSLGLVLNHGDLRTWQIPEGGGAPQLPGALVVHLPDVAAPVDVTLTAVDELGRSMVRTVTEQIVPHQQVRVDMVLAEDAVDGGVDDGAEPPDFAAPSDLKGVVDLAPPSDLAKPPVAAVQHSVVGFTANGTLTLTLSTPSTAGSLLVATLVTGDAGAITAPAGWTLATETVQGNVAHAAIFFYANNPGGISNVTFTIVNNTIKGQLSEWSGAAATSPFDQKGNSTASSATSASVSSGVLKSSGEVAITCYCEDLTVSNTLTFTAGSGWTLLGENGSQNNEVHYAADYRLHLSSGAATSETETSTVAGDWAAAVATFHP
jgi:hypothetical protein